MIEEVCQSTRGFKDIIFIHSTLDDSDLTPAEFRVFAHLSRRAGSGDCRPGAESIAKVCHIKRDTVFECIKELERRHILVRKPKTGCSNRYLITDPSLWILSLKQGSINNLPVPPNGAATRPPKRGRSNTDPSPQTGLDPSPQTGLDPSPQTGHEGNTSKGIPVRGGAPNKPTVENCTEEAKANGMPSVEGEKFFDHFESNGWKVGGKASMKDWRAAMRTWKRRWEKFQSNDQGRNFFGRPRPDYSGNGRTPL